jgi:hypothetical protein
VDLEELRQADHIQRLLDRGLRVEQFEMIARGRRAYW